MNILLINPPNRLIESDSESQNIGTVYLFPPLGLLYIASYINHLSHHKAYVVDLGTRKLRSKDLKTYLRLLKPSLVGITTYTHSLLGVIDTIQVVKSVLPDSLITLGGPHVKEYPDFSMRIKDVDFVIIGEGEIPLLSILSHIESRRSFDYIPGVLTKNSLDKVNEVLPFFIEDLDSLPFPDRSLLSSSDYFNILAKKNPVATILTGRGCPYNCTFCDSPRNARYRSLDKVIEEMDAAISSGFREIFFYDETFNYKEERVIDICDKIDRTRLRIPWSFRGRADKCSSELLERVKYSGCYRIQIGVETGSDIGLKVLNKAIKTSDVITTFKTARVLGIETVAYFMIGLPSERSLKDVRENIQYLIDLDPDYAVITILECLPGTILYQKGIEMGLFSDVWREFSQNPSTKAFIPFWTEFMTRDQLKALQKESLRKFYLRPKYLIKTFYRTAFRSRGKVFLELPKRAFGIGI